MVMARNESCCTSHFTIPKEIANHICDEIWILSFPISALPHAQPPVHQTMVLVVCEKCVSPWKKVLIFLTSSRVHFLWARSLHPSTGENSHFFPSQSTHPVGCCVHLIRDDTEPFTLLAECCFNGNKSVKQKRKRTEKSAELNEWQSDDRNYCGWAVKFDFSDAISARPLPYRQRKMGGGQRTASAAIIIWMMAKF